MKEGEGRGRMEGKVSFLLSRLLALFFARSLTLAPRSLLRNSTEMLATQSMTACISLVHEPDKPRSRQ